MIRLATVDDAESICAIYNHYVENSIATFEEENVAVGDMQDRIRDASEERPWFVQDLDGSLAGFAYASPWKSRCAYRFSLETTVYLSRDHLGQGIGTVLYGHLIEEIRRKNIHSLIAGIALPNEASIALHEKLGFEKVGQFVEVGWKFGHWIDVGYWELVFEKRGDWSAQSAVITQT
jgi:phosphinothricin acetyltransferase